MKITVKGIEFSVNLLDFDTAKAYEDGADRLVNLSKEIQSIPKLSDQIATACKITGEVIDSVLGAGAIEKLFNGKRDLGDYVQTWFEITQKIENGAEDAHKRSQKALAKLKHND